MKFSAVFTALTAALSVQASHSRHSSNSRNLVRNPSFEDDAGRPWGGVGTGVSIRDDRNLARTGRRSLLFQITTRNQRPEAYQLITRIQPNIPYALVYYYAVPKGTPRPTDNCQIRVYLYGGGDSQTTILGTGILPRTYTMVRLPFTALDESTFLQVFVYCQVTPPEEIQVVFDDFSIERTDVTALVGDTTGTRKRGLRWD